MYGWFWLKKCVKGVFKLIVVGMRISGVGYREWDVDGGIKKIIKIKL